MFGFSFEKTKQKIVLEFSKEMPFFHIWLGVGGGGGGWIWNNMMEISIRLSVYRYQPFKGKTPIVREHGGRQSCCVVLLPNSAWKKTIEFKVSYHPGWVPSIMQEHMWRPLFSISSWLSPACLLFILDQDHAIDVVLNWFCSRS